MTDDDLDVFHVCDVSIRVTKPKALMKIPHGTTSHLSQFGRNGSAGNDGSFGNHGVSITRIDLGLKNTVSNIAAGEADQRLKRLTIQTAPRWGYLDP